jgi:hypothetical protein
VGRERSISAERITARAAGQGRLAASLRDAHPCLAARAVIWHSQIDQPSGPTSRSEQMQIRVFHNTEIRAMARGYSRADDVVEPDEGLWRRRRGLPNRRILSIILGILPLIGGRE